MPWFLAALPAASAAAGTAVAGSAALSAAAVPAATGAAGALSTLGKVSSAAGGGGGGGGGIPSAPLPQMPGAPISPSVQGTDSPAVAGVAALPPRLDLAPLPATSIAAPPPIDPADIGGGTGARPLPSGVFRDTGEGGGRPLDLSREPGAAALAPRIPISTPDSLALSSTTEAEPTEPLAGRLPALITEGTQAPDDALADGRDFNSGFTIRRGLAGEPDVKASAAGQDKGGFFSTNPDRTTFISLLADFAALDKGRIPPSLTRDTRRQQAKLNKQKAEFELMDSWFKMNQSVVKDARGKPPEKQAEILNDAADLMDEKLFDGAGAILRHEVIEPGSIPDSTQHAIDVHPGLGLIYETGGFPAVQEAISDQKNLDAITAGIDAQALGPLTQWWNEDAWPFLLEHEPAFAKRIEEDGIREIGEVGEALELIPENARPPKAEFMAWLGRNADKVSFVDSEAIAEERQKSKAQEAGKRAATQEAGRQFVTTTDEHGRTIQTNIDTGEVSEAVKAPPTRTVRSQGLVEVTSPDGERLTLFRMSDASFQDGLGNQVNVNPRSKFNTVGTMKKADKESIDVSVGELSGSLASLVDLRANLKPGVTGARRILGKIIGGPAGLAFGEETGRTTTKAVSGVFTEGGGATPEEVIEFQQNAQDLSVEMISIFSGEKKGARLSDQDRQRGEKNANLITATADLAQLDAATKNLMGLLLKSDVSNRLAKGLPLTWDLETDAGINEFMDFAQNVLQVDLRTAKRWGTQMANQQRISRGLRGSGQ